MLIVSFLSNKFLTFATIFTLQHKTRFLPCNIQKQLKKNSSALGLLNFCIQFGEYGPYPHLISLVDSSSIFIGRGFTDILPFLISPFTLASFPDDSVSDMTSKSDSVKGSNSSTSSTDEGVSLPV